MGRRLSLETLESRITPTALGTLSFDGQNLVVNTAPVPVAGTGSTTLPANTIALQPASAHAATSLTATLGSLTTANNTDNYFLANAVQGSTLTVALAGTGPMGLSVVDQFGNILARQTGSGPLSLTVTNLPASGGVTVVVTASGPTSYLLTTSLSTPPSAPTTSTPTNSTLSTTPTTPTTPTTSTVSTTPAPVSEIQFTGGVGLPLIDPYGVGDDPAVVSNPMDQIIWEWSSIGNIQLYDPLGRPIEPWSPPAGFSSPSGLPFNPTPSGTATP